MHVRSGDYEDDLNIGLLFTPELIKDLQEIVPASNGNALVKEKPVAKDGKTYRKTVA